jgi:hypothetical protein
MNTREQHLQQEMHRVETKLSDIRTLLVRETQTPQKRANYQARLDVLQRRRSILQHLLHCP